MDRLEQIRRHYTKGYEEGHGIRKDVLFLLSLLDAEAESIPLAVLREHEWNGEMGWCSYERYLTHLQDEASKYREAQR